MSLNLAITNSLWWEGRVDLIGHEAGGQSSCWCLEVCWGTVWKMS